MLMAARRTEKNLQKNEWWLPFRAEKMRKPVQPVDCPEG